MFQQFPQKDVNETVLLHEGRFRVRAGDRCIESSGSAHLRWLPSPGIEFDIETDEPVGIDLDSLTVELPGFRTKKVVALSTHWGSTPSGRTSIRAYAGEMEWGGRQSLLSSWIPDRQFPRRHHAGTVRSSGRSNGDSRGFWDDPNGRPEPRRLAVPHRCRAGVRGPL